MNVRKPHFTAPARGRRGFSAIEVTAVAAIITVLALILLPAVNKRVDESKFVAAQDDMATIEKAMVIANAHTGQYFRLTDLSRPAPTKDDSTAVANVKVPPAFWNRTASAAEISAMNRNWKGPYIASFKNGVTLAELITTRPQLVNGDAIPGLGQTPGGGPIYICTADDVTLDAQDKPQQGGVYERKWPVDPWGNPYICFAPGRYGGQSGQIAIDAQDQRNHTSAVVYSLGPDGVPGDGGADVAANYFRETNVIGTGDDLSREF